MCSITFSRTVSRICLSVSVLFFTFVIETSGQTPSDEIGRIFQIYRANGNDSSFLLDDTQYQHYLIYSAVKPSAMVNNLISNEQQQRIDVHTDTSAGSGATTSAVSKGSVPWLFSFALEHGALTESSDNNVITFRGNVANITKAMDAKAYIDSYRKFQDDYALNLVSRVSFSVSFLTNQNGAASTNSQSTLAGYSAHIDLYNHRDPRDKRYISAWAQVVTHGLTDLATSVGNLHDVLGDKHTEALNGWRERATKTLGALTLSSLSDDDVRAAIKKIADDYVTTFGQLPDIQSLITNVRTAMDSYAQQKGSVVSKIESSPIVSVEYTNTRQSVTTNVTQPALSSVSTLAPLPDLSNVNVITGFPFIARSQVTFNASATFFNSTPKGSSSGSVRDWRLSGQLDIPLPEIQQIGKSTLSFSGLFVSLRNQPLGQQVLVNGIAESLTGNIGLFQAKFTIPIKGTGVKIPISLTTSNRTELIKESDVRGSIGITLDLNSIFAKSGTRQ